MLNDLQVITRYGITLRLVELRDAAFILALRNDQELSKHLSATSNKLENQINWLHEYKKREQLGEEYYFVAVDDMDRPWGTTRLSELKGTCFEIGSWLFAKDAPSGMAIKADIITREIGYDLLKFDCGKFNVRKANKAVWRYHLRYAPEQVNEDELNGFFRLSKSSFEKIKHKFLSIL